jgi:hypothetical protein
MAVAVESSEPTLIDLLRAVEAQRGISVDRLCESLEQALRAAYLQQHGGGNVVARVDRETAEYGLWERRVVAEVVTDPLTETPLSSAPRGYAAGDFLDRPLSPEAFGRLAARVAQQTIAKRVLEHEREAIYEWYKALEGTLVTGLVQRSHGGGIYVLLDERNEAVIARVDQSPREEWPINAWVTAEIADVRRTTRGPAIFLSRGSERFVRLVLGSPKQIVAGGRIAGYKTVFATTGPLDVAGARAELRGEPIVLRPWTDDRALMVLGTMPGLMIEGAEAFALDEHRCVVMESATIPHPDDLSIASQVVGWPVYYAEPGKADEVLATIEEAKKEPGSGPVDPELRARLEAIVATW